MDFGLLSKNGHSYWCFYPKTKCGCGLDGYSPLNEDGSDIDEEVMTFYNDDGNLQAVLVERNLCASDLCELLALKNMQPKCGEWTIVEAWADMGFERILEEHEYVLISKICLRQFSLHAEVKYYFRKDTRKFEMFQDVQFFPPNMVESYVPKKKTEDGASTSTTRDVEVIDHEHHRTMDVDGNCLAVYSEAWVREDGKWAKCCFLLLGKHLFISAHRAHMDNFVEKIRNKKGAVTRSDYVGVAPYADLTQFQIYASTNAKNQLRAPTAWGICLRTWSAVISPENPREIRCFAFFSERSRHCWLSAMRLAKYGKQLRDNYRAFKNRQVENIDTSEYNSYNVPNESIRSRVAMDFTGKHGRIVDDPQEARAIELAEGFNWKRRWRPATRARSVASRGIDVGMYVKQPWFHGGMTRDQATALISKHGTVDGVFLVRDSKSHPGHFVLTYKCKGKVYHTPIGLVKDPNGKTTYFSIDGGQTKFYDMLQLVEFHQLNAGVLTTKLTHYVVQNSATLSADQQVRTRDTPTPKSQLEALERASTVNSTTEPVPSTSGLQNQARGDGSGDSNTS